MFDWLRRLFKRKEKKADAKTTTAHQRRPERRYKPPKPGRQAIHQDKAKFFKGKGRGQLPHYRRSVKQKKNPDEEVEI